MIKRVHIYVTIWRGLQESRKKSNLKYLYIFKNLVIVTLTNISTILRKTLKRIPYIGR